MADPVRITDLANPQYTAEQKAILEYGETLDVNLTTDKVLKDAKEQTGLSDFGEEDFIERLSEWLACVEEDKNLRPLFKFGWYADCVRYAANRLKLRELLKKHPEIHDENIKAPIIVVGLPRSGTTHLVNLIAADQRLRSMPLWESMEPIPNAGENNDRSNTDPRFLRCQEAWGNQDVVLPYIRNMHEMTPDHVHEELELENLDFSSYNPDWLIASPRWRDYYLSHDQTPHYTYLKTALKALQWLHRKERWILKCPQHLEQLPVLMKTFPDATLAMTHRDPVAVLASTLTMAAYGDRIRRYTVDIDALVDFWPARIEHLLRRSVEDRHVLPQGRYQDVIFKDFMADDVGMVEKVYDTAGLEMTATARKNMDDYMLANPRGKYGQMQYDIEADFGLNPDELRKRFDFYFASQPGLTV